MAEKKAKKYLSGMVLSTLIISILLCASIIGVMIFLDIKNVGSSLGINLEHSWFSLIGTCISALISVNVPIFVMVKTLRHQKEASDKELRLRIMPIFKYDVLFNDDVPAEHQGGVTLVTSDGLIDNENGLYHFGLLKVTNIGAGHAKECTIDFTLSNDFDNTSMWLGTINIDKQAEESFVILTEKNVTRDIHNNCTLTVKYKDFADNQYMQTIDIGFGHREHYFEDDTFILEPYIEDSEPSDIEYIDN